MNDTEEKLMNRLNNILESDLEAINVKIFGARNQKSIEIMIESNQGVTINTVSYTHLPDHETEHDLVCRHKL